MLTSRIAMAMVAGVAGIVLTASLGNWQTRRGDEKAQRQAQWDEALAREPSPVANALDAAGIARNLPQRVVLRGRFVPEATIYVDNRIVDGVAGFEVVTPVALADGVPWILVDRGWAPRDIADPTRRPAAPIGDEERRIEGLAVEHLARTLDLGGRDGTTGGIWQNLDFAAYERASGRGVARFVVQQANDSGDGLRRVWTRPDAGVDKHRGYAFQWYSLAALITVLTAYFGGKALRRR